VTNPLPPYPKPTFTALELAGAAIEIVPKLPRLVSAAFGRDRIDPRLREVVLLSVAEALECRYCRTAHTELARGAGVDDDAIEAIRGSVWARLAPRERAAVVSALRRVGAGIGTDATPDARLEEHFRPEEVARIAALVDAIRIASLSGNTVDMLIARIRRTARPRRDSNVLSEAAVAAAWAAGAAPAAIAIGGAGAWRRFRSRGTARRA
jgi:AhpD family alkylhydroperoxidase